MGKLLLSRALLTMLVAPSASTSVESKSTSFMENVAEEAKRRGRFNGEAGEKERIARESEYVTIHSNTWKYVAIIHRDT